tara:strand:- start:243 stop:749 length:507 start_codon:yes stop_codon:yes gene_type:complete
MPDSYQHVLAQLKDIHLPKDISWWPLAPGWYLLMALLVVIIITSVILYWRWKTQRLSKKQALKILQDYQKQYQQASNPQMFCTQVSELLKRVALVYYPRHEVASLTGSAWVCFLEKTGKNTPFTKVKYELTDLPFEKEQHTRHRQLMIDELMAWSEKWIQQRRKPCLN